MTPENEGLYRSWQRQRQAAGHRELPRNHYALASLEAWCGGRALTALSRGDILGWAGDGLAAMAESSRASYFSSARAFYNWAASEEEAIIDKSPMRGLAVPKVSKVPVPMPPDDDVRQLVAVTERDRSPMGRRDTAMIRVMLDTGGPRASEVAGLVIAGRAGVPAGLGLDLGHDVISVVGKGGKQRTWPVSAKTAAASERWIRVRDQLPAAAGSPRLLVAFRGRGVPMTYSGVEDILARRCDLAGIPRLHPHQLRHVSYHHFLRRGGRLNDAMTLYGWDDDAMPRRYAAALETERAIEAGHALAIGDQW